MNANKLILFTLLVSLLFTIPPFASEKKAVTLVKAFPNLTFTQPVLLTHSNDGSNRIFVVQQDGLIKVFENSPQVTEADTFLNIQNKITTDNEMGLLGLAFHPDYATNDSFYVNYTEGFGSERTTFIARYLTVSGEPNKGDPNSERILLEINQPFTNHNGGMLQFGPDTYLYIGMGDGGSAGDPMQHGQDTTSLLGAILRINVDSSETNLNYAIPADNPFAGNMTTAREEIFAWGFRNPWRFSIDHQTGEFWAGDVGQHRIEEVNLIESGKNYGWRTIEGSECFNPNNHRNPLPSCNQTGLTLPVFEHKRTSGRSSITGGYIYRGPGRPELTNAYIYGDFETGDLWMLKYENNQVTADSLLLNTNLFASAFGIDQQDELYILDYFGGEIYKFDPTPITGIDVPSLNQPDIFQLVQNYPNPFNPATTISYRLEKTARVELAVYNTAGQKVTTLLDENKLAGEYQVKWQGENDFGELVASGVYFYKLHVGDLIQARKMVLLR